MVEKSADYALIMHHAVRHVGLKLEGAAPAALSISDMAKDYDHPVPADLNRVKRHEHAGSDAAAREWVIRYAVSLLNGALVVDGNMVVFADGKGFDDLTWSDGKKTKKAERPVADIYGKLRNPFDPMSGTFSENIRIDLGDLAELRQSMTAWGWIDRPQFRALGNARTKVVLMGHRRIAVAKELGIDWEEHVDWIDIGDGDAADAERFKLAIASNIGAKPLSPNDRKRLAAYLYNETEWSQDKIATALTVDQKTISRDLDELGIPPKSKRGRPKGAKNIDKRVEVRAQLTKEVDEKVFPLLEAGIARSEIARQVGISERNVQDSLNRFIGEQRKTEELQAAKPVVAFDMREHLQRQREWSEKTFGPGPRTGGIIDHITKELVEIEADPGDVKEWLDVVVLALDGAWRAGATPDQIIDLLVAKQDRNEKRVWPDWRTMSPDKAIEHDRSHDAQQI